MKTFGSGQPIGDPIFVQYTFSKAFIVARKLMIGPDNMPTRTMITLMDAPSDTEMAAIQRLEGTNRTCKNMRFAADLTTIASEDIYEARVSKLRYGLYKRDIPFGVYNLGVAHAMKEKIRSQNEGAVAYEKGLEIGRQRFKADLQQMSTQMQLDAMQSQLNSYNNSLSRQTYWNCDFGSFVGGSARVSCY